MAMRGANTAADYRLLVSRRQRRPTTELYGFIRREAIHDFPLPLTSGDAEPTVGLQTTLNLSMGLTQNSKLKTQNFEWGGKSKYAS